MRAVGLFGGTFDPVHIGHIGLARLALGRFNLSQVIFIPAASPPHKSEKKLAAFEHRVAMLALAIGDDSRMSICEVEKELPPPTYTIDTLSYLLRKNGGDEEYYFIIGIDAFLEIHSWKKYETVISKVHLIVAARPGYSVQDLEECLASLSYNKKKKNWYNESSGRKLYYLDAELADISSTDIRKAAKSGMIPKNAVAPAVYEYIKENSLYSANEREQGGDR